MLYGLYWNMTSQVFDYGMKLYFFMKCFDKYLFYHVLFLGTNSASLLKSNEFTLKMIKKHK